jgi:hypothetical protein
MTDSDGEGQLLVKGYVPETASDLRTQLRLAESGADIVNSVSIFGIRDTVDNEVTKFDLWSLDWTPKGRAGMETELISVSGEQAKEDDVMTREEVIASLRLDEVPESLQTALRAEGRAEVAGEVALAGEMKVIFEFDDEADSSAVIDAVRTLVDSDRATKLDVSVDEAIVTAEISAEMTKEAVRDIVLSKVTSSSTKEEIAGEIASALERPYVQKLTGETVVVNGGAGNKDEARKGSRWE